MKDQTHMLFFSLPRFDAPYQSTPLQIASILARDHCVYFADHPYTFLEALKGFWKGPVRKRAMAYFRKHDERKGEVKIILLPFVFPVNFLPEGLIYNFFISLNHALVSRRLNSYFRKNKVKELIYINSFDFYFPNLQRYLKPSVALMIYHCIDPLVKAFSLKHGQHQERELAAASDAIIVTSPALRSKFPTPLYPRGYLVPNGVDFSHFNLVTSDLAIHPAVAAITGKVMGYFGNIERRIDYALLLGVIEQLSDWHLVMAGPMERDYIPQSLMNHPRVVFTGAIPYKEAPQIIRRFNVAIIPFLQDEVSAGIYPLKMFEYLAAGKPIVSTSFNRPVLESLGDAIQCADSAREFAQAVCSSAKNDSPEQIDKRIELAAANTWQHRAMQFENVLEETLKRKNNHVH